MVATYTLTTERRTELSREISQKNKRLYKSLFHTGAFVPWPGDVHIFDSWITEEQDLGAFCVGQSALNAVSININQWNTSSCEN